MTTKLQEAARQIFLSALQAVDPRAAVRREVKLDHSLLRVRYTEINIDQRPIYVLAIGKAAASMTAGIKDVLGDRIAKGIVCGPTLESIYPSNWQTFRGGHPSPNAQSIAAARAAVDLVKAAPADALIIFLISGGGSAMLELPVNDDITLADLREANRLLVASGATINEINAVRRAFSAVKGGKLAAVAEVDQITLIVSDTNAGDAASVASGPTIPPNRKAPVAAEVIKRFGLEDSLPKSIIKAIANPVVEPSWSTKRPRVHHVLLDNHTALVAAAASAVRLGFAPEIATDINEQDIDAGCNLMLSRAETLRRRSDGRAICLVSGGEFSCQVRGDGVGGRNLETVLRCALKLQQLDSDCVVLSAGTDGIDGNSSAAGAFADRETVNRGIEKGLDAASFLERSDSFHFFEQLGDLLITGLTGTNVRDVRILLIGARASRPQ